MSASGKGRKPRRKKTVFFFFAPTVAPGFVMDKIRREYSKFAPGIIVVNYEHMGLGKLSKNHAWLCARVQEHLAEAMADGTRLEDLEITIFAWSHGCIHAIEWALDHPNPVKRLVLMAGPINGSKMSYLLGGVKGFERFFPKRVPILGPATILLRGIDAFKDMTPTADHTKEIRAKIQAAIHTLKAEILIILADNDHLVHPNATLLPVSDNVHVLWMSRSRPRGVPEDMNLWWLPIRNWFDDVTLFHLTVAVHWLVKPFAEAAVNGTLRAKLAELAASTEVDSTATTSPIPLEA